MNQELFKIFQRWGVKDGGKVLWQMARKTVDPDANVNYADENYRLRQVEKQGFCILQDDQFWHIYNKSLKIICRKFSSDIEVFSQIFINDDFKELLAIVKQKEIIVETFIDAGSNIGLSTIKISKDLNIKFIVGIEPDQDNLKVLQQNLINNNIKANILEGGIWNKTCRLYFDRSFRDGKDWSIMLTEKPISEDYVESYSFNDLITKYNLQSIDLLKIDIEGAERFVFNKEELGLEFLNITKVIAIEVHEEFPILEHIEQCLLKRAFQISRSGEYLIGYKEM